MEINQLSQLVTYVDAERRKDRQALIQLQERVEGLLRELEARTRYANQLEATVNDLKLQVQRLSGWQTGIEQLRAEFGSSVERIEDQRGKAERESARVRQIEIESLVRQLNELRKEVKPYGNYAESLEVRRQEDARLAELIGRTQLQVTDLDRRLESPGQSIAYLEEQRRQDNKRILALEQELSDARRRMETFPPQLLLLDEAVRRKTTEIEDAAKLLEAQGQVIESQRVSDIRRERQFAEYAEMVEQLKERSTAVAAQVIGFTQMREEVRRALSDVPEIEGRLEARFNELAEIVRDNIDRTKRISDEFHDTIEKEWKAFAVSQDEQWAERDRRGADLNPRLETLEEAVARLPLQINPLYEMFEAWAKAYAETGRAWLVQSNKALDEARTAVPSDVKLSRRQRKKIEAQRQEPGDEPADPDLIT
ncbi:MAG: hypothetical protein K1X39_02610 [Thermoflexales bacterium]|nr:hypothetical protein [Thermoflexales bacterium]